MEHRFTRAELVLGTESLRHLAETKVVVVGVGGVGGYVAEALARSGIGSLVLVDHDIISITNLNRQIIALESTLGRPKVEVMAERIKQINPDCQVVIHQAYYTKDIHNELISSDVDFVADAIDSVQAKADLIEQTLSSGVAIISSLGTGNKLDLTRLTITDISQTHTCPLARAVRLALRKRGVNERVTVVFSPEQPVGKREGSLPGSTSFVPPAAGLLMASWIVRQVSSPEETRRLEHGPI
ncbi:MAG: tRNA threonylcarbamoyladenosine dehydratase [Limnochordia bacterium]|jgi:tRNA A37 threonylcarbamoyladenosine dehydratase|nr:tRNA threonylcarbamoyladenosine dehydratase [Limnochordia bacterium]